MSGKGSTPRPIPDRAAYEANWDGINWSARDGVHPMPAEAGSDQAGSQEVACNEAGGHQGGG